MIYRRLARVAPTVYDERWCVSRFINNLCQMMTPGSKFFAIGLGDCAVVGRRYWPAGSLPKLRVSIITQPMPAQFVPTQFGRKDRGANEPGQGEWSGDSTSTYRLFQAIEPAARMPFGGHWERLYSARA